VSEHQVYYPVATMCRVLEISTSGYYAWRQRPLSRRAREDARLRARIETIHTESRGTYGSPRVHAELAEAGVRISRRRVARLMKQARLEGVSRRRRSRTTRRGTDAQVVPDLVKRNFRAEAANQLWVSDITYVSTWAGFLYLAIVLDAYSRRVVGWSMANHLRTELVLEALNMAIWQRRPGAVIHHSDQGTQYTSIQFGKRCKQLGVRPSTGSVGDAYDNAMAESFFATSVATRRRGWRSSSSSKASTTHVDATPRSAASPQSSTSGGMDQTRPRKWKLPWPCRSLRDPHSPLEAAARLPRVPTSLLLRVPKLQAFRCPPK